MFLSALLFFSRSAPYAVQSLAPSLFTAGLPLFVSKFAPSRV